MKSSAPRAVASSLVLGAIFEGALFGSKETPAVYGHAPWLNDPYDTAVSFALFCIPLIIVPSALRLLADSQWPDRGAPERLTDLLRACGVALVVVGATLAACWAAVAAGANHAAWRPVTAIQVVLLALVSVGAIACAVRIRRAARALRAGTQALEADAAATELGSVLAPDWLGDMIGAGRLLARVCGPIGRPATRALDWADDRVVPLVRRHPIGAAAVLGGAVGLAVTVSQSVTEGYRPVIAAVFFLIASCGVFAFAVTAGSYLRVIRTKRPARARAPLIRATVLAAAAVPVALAFRAPLWSFVGADPRGSGLGALLLLLGSVALLAFGVGLAGERLARASCVKQVPGQRARLR
jgi:hypothetical protein